MMNLNKIIDSISEKYYSWKAKMNLLSSKRESLAVFEIMEKYLTREIMRGRKDRRQDLLSIQHEAEEHEKFIKFLKELK